MCVLVGFLWFLVFLCLFVIIKCVFVCFVFLYVLVFVCLFRVFLFLLYLSVCLYVLQLKLVERARD